MSLRNAGRYCTVPREWVQAILVVICVTSLMLLRPSVMQGFSEILFLIYGVGFVLYISINWRVQVSLRIYCLLFITAIVCIYLSVQGTLMGTIEDFGFAKDIAYILAGASLGLILNRANWGIALKTLVYPTLALSVCYTVSLALILIFRLPFDSLELYRFTVSQGVDEGYSLSILFPFSPVGGLGKTTFYGTELVRAVGYMREPGIYQILIVVSYFSLGFLEVKKKYLWRLLLATNLLLTFSTAGIASFLASKLYTSFARSTNEGQNANYKRILIRSISVLALASVGLWFVTTEQKVGIGRKLRTTSGRTRVEQVSVAISLFKENPILGAGYKSTEVIGGNLLSVVAQFGTAGTLLLFALVLLPNMKRMLGRSQEIVILIPPLMTMALSQPLFDKSLFYVLGAIVASAPRSLIGHYREKEYAWEREHRNSV